MANIRLSAKEAPKESVQVSGKEGVECTVEGFVKYQRPKIKDMNEVVYEFSRLELTNETMMQVIGHVKSTQYYQAVDELKKAEEKIKELELNYSITCKMLRKTCRICRVMSSMFENQLVPIVNDKLVERIGAKISRLVDADWVTKRLIDRYISRNAPVVNDDRTELILSFVLRADVPQGGQRLPTVTLSFRFSRIGENWFLDAVNGNQEDDAENSTSFMISVEDTLNGGVVVTLECEEPDDDGWELLTHTCLVKDGFVFKYFADRGEEIQEQRYVHLHAIDENDEIVHQDYYPLSFDTLILRHIV
jgi:hypothetical protein